MTDISDEYSKSLEEMFSLGRFGIKLGLETINGILEKLGNPHNNFRCIHIAGTNGKGSTASTISTILQKSGYKVGLYTSPHLVDFNERICINGAQITDKGVVETYKAVKEANGGLRQATFFEITTAMALYEFSQEKVDWAVIETGMGGRLDATNALNPSLCIITNISLEHQAYLGDTIPQITKEKGGIIKRGVPVVTGVKQGDAIAEIEDIAKKNNAPLYKLGTDFKAVQNDKRGFSYYGINSKHENLLPSLQGDHQIDNTSLAIAACELLIDIGADNITAKNIEEGVKETKWPGRLEIVSEDPLIIIDGAHNLAAAENLAAYLKKSYSDRKIKLVIGILDDKPYDDILKTLLEVSDSVILTQPQISRRLPVDTLLKKAKKYCSDTSVIRDVGKAIEKAMSETEQNQVICIAGSLYVAGEAKRAITEIFQTR